MSVEPGTGPGRTSGSTAPTVVREHPVPPEMLALTTLAEPDYVDVFTLGGGIPERSPEEWARVMLDKVAGLGGQFIWRVLLGLRLQNAPDRVAGWALAARGADHVRLEASSPLMTAHLVVRADAERVTLATVIRYDSRPAALVWGPLSALHRALVPGLMRDAAAVRWRREA
jgi:hypothetical protein